MKLFMSFLLLSVMFGCASKPKPISLGFTGAVVVKDFTTKTMINSNPIVLTDAVIDKMQSSLTKYITLQLPREYQITITDKCDKNTLQINGEFTKVNTDTDLNLNPIFVLLSHRELVIKAEMQGQIVDCETGKVLSRFERDTKDKDFNVLINALSETVVDEFEYIALKQPKSRK